ncbi:hypothetical protein PAMA_008868 [Pampus argenteus]
MDPQAVLPHDGRELGARPRRKVMPPRYLQDYQAELYGRPPHQPQERAEPVSETPETALLRQEVAQLKGMVHDLMDRVQQYEQSYPEENSEEEQDEEAQQAPYGANHPLPIDKGPQCEKALSEPNLSESAPALHPGGTVSQSAQTLSYCVHQMSALLQLEHTRPVSAPLVRSDPPMYKAPSPLPAAAAVYIPPLSSTVPVSEPLNSVLCHATSSHAPVTQPHWYQVSPHPFSQAPVPARTASATLPNVSSHYIYFTATSQSSSSVPMSYHDHTRLSSHAVQPPPVTAPQAVASSSQPFPHPGNAPYQFPYMPPQLTQQHQAQGFVSQPAPVSYASHFTGSFPPPNLSFSLPVAPVQQTVSSSSTALTMGVFPPPRFSEASLSSQPPS